MDAPSNAPSNAFSNAQPMLQAMHATYATYATNERIQDSVENPYVPDAPDPVDNEVQVTREDLLRTRVVLAELQMEQERLGAELESTGLTDFADRADWLMAHQSPDRKLAWRRHWQRLGISDPEPREPRRRKSARLGTTEMLDELDWLLGNGATPWEAAQALGSSRDAISRLAYRHGRPDLGKRIQRTRAERSA